MFKSKLEKKFHLELKRKTRRKKNIKVKYESMRLSYFLEKTYIPDFVIYFPDGRVRIIEVKGYLRSSDRSKMIAVKRNNPDLDIRFVFAQDNKLSSKSPTRYSEWAKKNGFPYAINTIPKDWLV